MAIGARALHDGRLIEIEPTTYRNEIAQKRAILASDHRYYAQECAGSTGGQWECVELILKALKRDYAHLMTVGSHGDRWTIANHLLGEQEEVVLGDPGSIPTFPLDWIGRHVQEDLLLMSGDPATGFALIAGQLCFANRWCLDDTIGRSFRAIHAPVPGFAEQIGEASEKLMERLKLGRPVWRLNWSVLTSGELNRPPRHADAMHMERVDVSDANAGQRCFFRAERQTLTRLPASAAILFTVRTYVAPVGQLAADPEWRRRMLGVLDSAPPELLAYKGMTSFVAPLRAFLRQG